MKRIGIIVIAIILLCNMAVYADINFEIERVGYEYISDVAYNGEVCVAVGGRGQILASRDFTNWEFCDSGDYTSSFQDVFWLGDRFIIIGRAYEYTDDGGYTEINIVYESTDGYHWSKAERDEYEGIGGNFCYVLDDGNIIFDFSDDNNKPYLEGEYKIFGDYNKIGTLYLPEEKNRLTDFDTKGGIRKSDWDNTIVRENGEEYPLPERTEKITLPSGVKDLSVEKIGSWDSGYQTELDGVKYIVNGYRNFDNTYSSNCPEVDFASTSEYFSQLLGEEMARYARVGNHFVAYHGFTKKEEWNSSGKTEIKIYDRSLHYEKTKDFGKYVERVEDHGGQCLVTLGEYDAASQAETYTYMLSSDYESWREVDKENLPPTVYDYEKVFENPNLNGRTWVPHIGMWNMYYDDENRKARMLSDDIYGIDLKIPFSLQNVTSIPGKYLFWEEGEYLYVRDGNIQLKTPKQAFYNAVTATEDRPYVVLNNKVLAFDVPPVEVDGNMLVPMRFLFEQMGAEVSWDNETQTASVSQNNGNVSFQINNVVAQVNSEAKQMNVPAQLVEDKTMVPIRFLSENLGYTVDWNGEARMAMVTAQ